MRPIMLVVCLAALDDWSSARAAPIQQAQPAGDRTVGAQSGAVKQKGAPKTMDKPAVTRECQSALDGAFRELTRARTDVAEAKVSGTKLKAANTQMLKARKEYAKAQKATGATVSADTATAGAQSKATAGPMPEPAGLASATRQVQDRARDLNLLGKRTDQDLVRARTQVDVLKGCRSIPSGKMQRLVGLATSIRTQIKGQVSSLTSMSGGGGSGAGCAGCVACYDCCRGMASEMERICEMRCDAICAFEGAAGTSQDLWDLLAEILKQNREQSSQNVNSMKNF